MKTRNLKTIAIVLSALMLSAGPSWAKKNKKPAGSLDISGISVQGLFLTEKGSPYTLKAVERQGLLHLNPDQLKAFFDQAKLAGANAVKTNAFTMATPGGLPTDVGNLDQVVASAKEAGLKLVLSLASDSSPDGGKAQYASQAGSTNPNVFFYDYKCKDNYQAFVNSLFTRVNKLTHLSYTSDPTILAWDLVDSPVNQGDDGDQVNRWVSTMASYVKALAPRQLTALTLWAQAPGVQVVQAAGQPGVDLLFFRIIPGRSAATPAQAAQAIGKPVAGVASAASLSAWSRSAAGAVASLTDNLTASNEALALQPVFAGVAANAEALPTGLFQQISTAENSKPALEQEASMKVSLTLTRPAKVAVRYGLKGVFGQETALSATPSTSAEVVLEHLRAGETYAYQVKAVDETGKTILSDRQSFTAPIVGKVAAMPLTKLDHFITVKGTEFYDGDKPFRYVGTNNYYLHYDPKSVEYILGEAEKLGLTVMRTWAFGETNQKGLSVQDQLRYFVNGPGQYVESSFKALDKVVASAAKHHVRLILGLSNNWTDFGGAPQWVQYFGSHDKNDFFDKPEIKKAYKDYMAYVVNRVNTVTGLAYKNDPTIMAWDLMNEPRYERDTSGKTLAAWVDEMASFLKAQGVRQLVTTGSEGLRAENGTHYSGSDYLLVHQSPSIDFAVFHIYPADDNNQWNWPTTKAIIEAYVRDGHSVLKKPVVMEEFGIAKGKLKYDRPVWIYDMVRTFYAAGGNGSNYWMLTEPQYAGDGNEFSSNEIGLCNIFTLQANELAGGK